MFEDSRYISPDIKETTGYDAEVSYIDLADFSSITAFVQKLNDNGKGKVDLALLNAGVNLAQYQLSKDGWESKYAFVSTSSQRRLEADSVSVSV